LNLLNKKESKVICKLEFEIILLQTQSLSIKPYLVKGSLVLNRALKRSKENILGLLGSKYYQNEERSEANPLVYGRKRENQRYQSYQASNALHSAFLIILSDLSTNYTISLGFQRQRP
jgi:hypothetical protein